MDEFIVGKHTLESLTTGMYSDPLVVYREYIQNSADSIDEARNNGLLKKNEGCITISLLPESKRIEIYDNGIGVSISEAAKTLVSIGNSKKSIEQSRGFRGIGRLSALSYCEKLTFETSTYNEKIGTRVCFDANVLNRMLTSESSDDTTVSEVLKKISDIETYTEKGSVHYFRVIMEGVEGSSHLEEYSKVYSYISQNAPVSYNADQFKWGKEIRLRMQQKGFEIKDYKIELEYKNKTHEVFKPYKDEFIVDKRKNISDRINDINILQIKDLNKEVIAIGWIAETNYLGSISDKELKGLRLRVGNILIGDGQTLNIIFKDPRFNGWTIGEIFIIDPKLIPNARRDNFEKNEEYYSFIEQLIRISNELTKKIRKVSLMRNIRLATAIKETNDTIQNMNHVIEEGKIKQNRKKIQTQLVNVKNNIINTPTNNEVDVYYRGIAFDELDMIIGNIKGITSYKSINTIKNLNNDEKKILEKVFDVIIKIDSKNSDKYLNSILEIFK